jgi:homoserine O-acetyltransferase
MKDSVVVPCFEFEDGSVVRDAEVVYSAWGELNEDGDNVILVCHTLTGDTDASDWWGGLLGPGKALDTDCFFIICASVIGSPYGGLSPLTVDPDSGRHYGPDFPTATVRDTVRLHRQLLEILGVRHVILAIGASLGAMQALEWALEDDFVDSIVPIAVGATHSAWGIAWSETQRQCIFADPKWDQGRYELDDPPAQGLANARMVAMLSYRCGPAYKARFGRNVAEKHGTIAFDVEHYLRYQGRKLVSRFDANCYVSITRQMNSHDVGRDRGGVEAALASLTQETLMMGIKSDFLYPVEEQQFIADLVPNARLEIIDSPHGHDAFLIELDHMNELVKRWIDQIHPAEAQCHAA